MLPCQFFLVGCGSPNYSPSEMHLTYEEVKSEKPVAVESIPSLVKTSPALPALGNLEEAETYDVVVTKVPVRDLLFALARDSGVNMDVDARVGGVDYNERAGPNIGRNFRAHKTTSKYSC